MMKDYGHRRKDNKLAVVVVGEASESEDEDDEEVDGQEQQESIDHRTVAIETIGKYVDGPAATAAAAVATAKQVTDSKSSLLQRIAPSNLSTATAANRHTEDDNGRNESSGNCEGQLQHGRSRTSSSSTLSSGGNKTLADSSSLTGGGLNRSSKDSLLNNLLKETNTNLKQNLIHLSCTPYATATKEVGRITRQLIASQRSLQSGCALLHKSVNDIAQLNRSFITLSTFMSINKKLQ